jgi:hypothetical protein
MLPPVEFHEYFIDVEGITVALVLSLQSSSVYRSEFDTPQPDGFIADSDASFCQEIFDITVAEIESIVEPNCVADDVWGPPRCGNRWRLYVFMLGLSPTRI